MKTLAATFLAAIVLANIVTNEWGLIPIGFGMMTTAGTIFAGLTFALRDSIQDRGGRVAVVALILLGAGLSAAISPALAVASGVAFLASELADMAIYTPLREGGYGRAALASNLVGAIVDTLLFLTLAGFPLSAAPGQVLGKFAVTLPFVALVVHRRRARRPLPATA